METFVLLSVSRARRFYPYWQRLLDHRSYNILSLAKTRNIAPQRRKMNRTDLAVLLTCGWTQSLPGVAVVHWYWRTHSLRGQRTQASCLQVCNLSRSQHPLLNSQFLMTWLLAVIKYSSQRLKFPWFQFAEHDFSPLKEIWYFCRLQSPLLCSFLLCLKPPTGISLSESCMCG